MTKNGDILSTWMELKAYYGGAHDFNSIIAVTVNTKTGQEYDSVGDLFQASSSWKEVLKNKVVSFLEKNLPYYDEYYIDEIMQKKVDFQYYIDGNQLVIFFNPYQVGAFMDGIVYVTIPVSELQEYMKPEIYESIKDAKPLGFLRINGVDAGNQIQPQQAILRDFGKVMLPLRAVCDLIGGYQVDYNDGDALVNGNSVAYDSEPEMINGTLYVPISYFNETLRETVYYGKGFTWNDTTPDSLKIFTEEVKVPH